MPMHTKPSPAPSTSHASPGPHRPSGGEAGAGSCAGHWSLRLLLGLVSYGCIRERTEAIHAAHTVTAPKAVRGPCNRPVWLVCVLAAIGPPNGLPNMRAAGATTRNLPTCTWGTCIWGCDQEEWRGFLKGCLGCPCAAVLTCERGLQRGQLNQQQNVKGHVVRKGFTSWGRC